VNPSVLGGLVVDFGEKTIDLTISSRVNKLNNLLQGRFLFYSRCSDLMFFLEQNPFEGL